MHELTTRHYSVREVWASLTKSKIIFCAGSIPKDIRKAKKQICGESAETISRLRVESCTTGNVPPEVRNHGKCAKEARMKRRESLSHAMLALLGNCIYKDFNEQAVEFFSVRYSLVNNVYVGYDIHWDTAFTLTPAPRHSVLRWPWSAIRSVYSSL